MEKYSFHPGSGSVAQFPDITEELRFQYALAYNSTNPLRDGSFRRIPD